MRSIVPGKRSTGNVHVQEQAPGGCVGSTLSLDRFAEFFNPLPGRDGHARIRIIIRDLLQQFHVVLMLDGLDPYFRVGSRDFG
jgi:hypothetical protein